MSVPPRLYVDFEYRDNGRQLIFAAIFHAETATWYDFDFRGEPGRHSPAACRRLQAFVAEWCAKGAVWYAFAAMAEIAAMLTAGVDVDAMKWVCLLAEGRQITASHAKFRLRPRDTNLLSTLAMFGIQTRGDPAAKKAMVAIILATDQYDDATWAALIDYCHSDIEPLPALCDAYRAVFARAQLPYDDVLQIARGDYLKASCRLEATSPGFPIASDLLHRIYQNKQQVMVALASACNETYGPVYRLTAQGTVHFHFKALKQNIALQPRTPDWEVTASGRPKMAEDFLSEFVEKNPYYKPLADCYTLLNHFSRADLRPMVQGDFLVPKGAISLPYHTSTSRNQPLVSNGFLLNMRPWLRSLVCPQPDHLIVAADWSQQEQWLAAALSGDRNLRAMLETGDVYLALATRARAVPDTATKLSHPVVRQTYKSAQLGLSYGMQHETLGRTIHADLRAQAIELHLPLPCLDACIEKAREILAWHHAEFHVFWDWSERVVWEAKRYGSLRTVDGWTTFADQHSSPTRLGNFLVQASGAAILRQSVKALARSPVRWLCSLHDALYVYCHQDDEVETTNHLLRAMTIGTEQVMGLLPMPLAIPLETTIYGYPSGYRDKRDLTTLPRILALLDAQGL